MKNAKFLKRMDTYKWCSLLLSDKYSIGKNYSKYLFGYKNDAEDLDNMIFILEISLST